MQNALAPLLSTIFCCGYYIILLSPLSTPSVSFQNRADVLIEQQRDNGDNQSFQNIKGYHREKHQCPHAVYTGIDSRPHADNGFHGYSVQLRKFRKQIQGVKRASENGHDNRTQRKSQHRRLFALFYVINNGRRQHQTAAHHKVGEIAYEGCRGSLKHQFQQHLAKLRGHSRHRSHGKGADHHRNLAEIHLVKARSEPERQLKQHENCRNRRKHTHNGYAARRRIASRHFVLFPERFFRHAGYHKDCDDNQQADA